MRRLRRAGREDFAALGLDWSTAAVPGVANAKLFDALADPGRYCAPKSNCLQGLRSWRRAEIVHAVKCGASKNT